MTTETLRRRAGLVTVTIAVAAIARATLLPGQPQVGQVQPACCQPADILLNILLFVPLGIGLALLRWCRSWPALALAGSLLSAGIEAAQLWWIPNRFPAVTDIVSNGLGTVLGGALVIKWSNRANWWRRLGPALAIATVLFWVQGATLVKPAHPRPGPVWWTEWQPSLKGAVQFPGRILAMSLQGTSLPNGPIPESRGLATRLAGADTIRYSTLVETGPSFQGRSPLIGLYMGRRREGHLALWQEGRDLFVHHRLVMARWRLRAPALRVRDAFPESARDTVSIAVEVSRKSLGAVAESRHRRVESILPLSPDLAWTSFLPFEYRPVSGRDPWPVILAVGTFALIGAGLVRHSGLLPIAGVVALLPAPLLAKIAFPSPAIFLAAGLGLLLGNAAARWLGLGADRRRLAVSTGPAF